MRIAVLMGKVFAAIDDKLERWIAAQQLFFVATAPTGGDGHVNCSPKGPIESPVVVDAAGAWSALLADEVGIRVPMVPTRHQLFITEPLAGLEPHHPIVRIHEPTAGTIAFEGTDMKTAANAHTVVAGV